MKRKAYTLAQKAEFEELFGRSLQEYWSGLTGFEYSKFSDEVPVAEDESFAEYLLRENIHGIRAVALIKALIEI